MTKIVVTKDSALRPEEIKRLKKLGDLTVYDSLPKSYDEWVERCKDAKRICHSYF